jgi:hypothetical protein
MKNLYKEEIRLIGKMKPSTVEAVEETPVYLDRRLRDGRRTMRATLPPAGQMNWTEPAGAPGY